MILLYAFFISLLLIGGSVIYSSYSYGISPTPSSFKAIKSIIDLLPKSEAGNIFELGSGWGTLAFALAKRFPHCKVKAYEASLVPWLISWILWRGLYLPNLYLYKQDFFQVSLEDADIVVCYLYREGMRKLKHKFEAELQPGTWIVSHTFAVPGWAPVHVHRLDDLYRTPIYLYQMPR
jgi:hypothetical protein